MRPYFTLSSILLGQRNLSKQRIQAVDSFEMHLKFEKCGEVAGGGENW
jgi:hypothetical protein